MLPCTDDSAECLLDEKSINKVMTLLVSNDIVTQEFNSTANAKSEVRANLQIYTFVL